MYLYKNIKVLRKRRGMTQAAVANILEKTTTVMSGYESGGTLPPLDVVIQLIELFHINADDFLFKDLSKEDPDPYIKRDASVNEDLLIEMLKNRVRELERELKASDPEKAKRLGIE